MLADFDVENVASIVKTSKVKFYVAVGVVIFSMVFNGTIYGYTRDLGYNNILCCYCSYARIS